MIVLRSLSFWLCCWVCFFIIAACSNTDTEEVRLTAASLLAEPSTEGFSRATEIRQFQFPQDHSSHPDYRSEWWYITGNLVDEKNQKQAFGKGSFDRISTDRLRKRDFQSWHFRS